MGTQPSIVPVTITLKSAIQHPGQDADLVELETEGTIVEKAGNRYLRYEEEQDQARIKTMIKLDPEDAFIMRTGALQMRLPFAPERPRFGTYTNGPLELELRVVTKALTIDSERTTGTFHVQYDMHSEESLLGSYQLTITYAEGIQ